MSVDFELIARSDWDPREPNWARTGAIPHTGVPGMLHHTGSGADFPGVEPEDWPDGDDPRPGHLGICRAFRAPQKMTRTRAFREKVAARRAWNASHPDDPITKWAEIEHRRRGGGPDERGRHRYVSVRVDLDRQRQVSARNAAQRAQRLALVTRLRLFERATMRRIDAYHRSLGWLGGGYPLVQFGRRIYAMRARVVNGQLVAVYRGAHCGAGGWNGRPAVSLAGNFVGKRLRKTTRRALTALVRHLRWSDLVPHRAEMATVCPGVSDQEIDDIVADAHNREG